MKKIVKFISEVAVFVVLPMIIGMAAAYQSRGYFAVGGELFFPVVGAIFMTFRHSYLQEQK